MSSELRWRQLLPRRLRWGWLRLRRAATAAAAGSANGRLGPVSRPSKNFTWHELGHPPRIHRRRARHLARHLERARVIGGGRPLPVIGGYRSGPRNRRVGGAKDSQHLRGAAADIPPGHITTREAVDAGFTGIGSAGPWAVHVDVRPGPVTFWRY